MADITHPPMEQLQDLEYCIDSNPPWVETILLAFQNYILMLGTSVMIPSMLVPAMGGSSGDKAQVIQTLLFVAGINTLLQALFGTRLPAVVGGSFAYVIPIAYIISDSSLQRINDPHERFLQTMRAIQGALIVASSIQIVLGYSQIWGLFSRFFSPLGMAPVVGLVGLGFIQRGFPALGNCVEIGIPMLLLIVGLSQYLKHVRLYRDIPIFERFPVLICVTIVWIYSVILTASGAYRHKATITQNSCRTDRANLISTAPWYPEKLILYNRFSFVLASSKFTYFRKSNRFMLPYPLQWGPPTFSAGHSFAMMSAVIVSMVESTGAYKAASRLAIATPPPAYVLSRGIGWQGIGILLDGLYGTGTGSTVSVENVGLLGLTRVGSRRVVQISAGFMIFFSTLGKFGAVFASIPFPIFAAIYCVVFGLVAAVGISFLQFTNMNSMRNLIITGLTLFLGISVPHFFNQYWTSSHHGPVHTNAGWFNAFLNTIFSSPATVGLIVAVFLDNTLEVERSKKDRGMPWWVKFRTFRGDNRNEEFYTLPFNLNRFFPPT
ncbi:nucleobase-ascorbate transporter 1 isoform X1 [Vigna umbellata]|uniref:nucleobase-ascorbate transporter 1 isoform X1 n=2 Tax=Vigna TaxID=3913 RepID=UPI00080A1CDC|nr:nucleobase-ascorbate transporter 1 isoform X1 [Vigna angularis]XP_047166193.1 nucleobase-ascorbate transporter 1 isoform X1 [Vigna umbellata]